MEQCILQSLLDVTFVCFDSTWRPSFALVVDVETIIRDGDEVLGFWMLRGF